MSLPRTALLLSATDPNDPVASDVWANVAGNRLLRISSAGRGRQYEVGQSVPGRLDGDLLNIDEYLNRANSSSPLLNNTELMRRVRLMAVHPADGAGNLVNLLNMRADPSFESYAVGPGPSWTWFFGAAPTVTATGPHTGTRALVQTITAGGGLQGVVLDMEFIPGDTYTVSIWVNQTAANRIDLAINGHLSTPMASTSATGYTQLVGTFIADQPTLQVCVVNQAPGLAGTVTYDEVQVEQGTILNANPYFETDAAGWFGQGGTIARSTAQAHQGVASLLLTPSGSAATAEVDANSVPIVAGRTHAASAWVRCAVSRSVFLTINWFLPDGTYLSTAPSTSVAVTANTWTLITINAVAPATAGRGAPLVGMSSTPPGSNTLHIDEVTMVSPSAFTTSGPRVRSLWGGHAERLPITWDATGSAGMAKLTAIGPLAALAGIGMQTDWGGVLGDKAPDLSWPLWDGVDATAWAETSGNRGPALTRVNSSLGPGPAFSSGASMPIPGDPGATGVTLSGTGDFSPTPTTVLTAGRLSAGARPIAIGSATLPVGVTMSTWVRWSTLPTARNGYLMAMFDDAGAIAMSIKWDNDAGNFLRIKGLLEFAGSSPNITLDSPNMSALSDGKPHLIQLALSATTTVANLYIYIDGVLQGTSVTRNPTTDAWPPPFIFTNVQVGAAISPFNGTSYSGIKDGVYAWAGLWNRALSTQDVTDLWNAGRGYAGETPGARLGRFFNRYYVGPTVLDTGTTKLVPSGVTAGTKVQQAAQRVVESAYGDLFENRKAALEFDDRSTRFLNTVSQGVFGENVAGGEIPYSGAPTFGYDVTQISNQATVTQTAGTKATSNDPASIRSYYQRSITAQTDTQDPLEAQDYADHLVANRKKPKQRVERITLDLGANPSITGAALDLEKGQRWTIVRRPRSANSGAGITMQADYFIENITHRQVDFEKGTWLVDLILSPVQLQPWILGDPTYGQLGITTVAGF